MLKGRLGKRKLRILELGEREIEENIYLEKEKYRKRKINGKKWREGKIGEKGNLEKGNLGKVKLWQKEKST